jgi:hypothetical protein
MLLEDAMVLSDEERLDLAWPSWTERRERHERRAHHLRLALQAR